MKCGVFKFAFGAVCLWALAVSAAENPLDTFGIKKIFRTAEGSVEWNSAHWANGTARNLDWDGDSYDPLGWTDNHSGGSASPYFKIDGQGVMQMMSKEPRFHINAYDNSSAKKQFFKNVEWTGYYRRGATTTDAPNWGGMVVGVRSGNLGHASSGGNNCDASTYYARFRHDGAWDFEKEWKHPDSYYQSMGVVGQQTKLWGGAKLPADRWIGMKYIVYNSDANTVHLELYIDSVSGGDAAKAVWQKVGEADDSGEDWSGAGAGKTTIDGCASYNGLTDAMSPILEGHGAVLMRTDGQRDNEVQGEYKMVTIREIDPAAPFGDAEPDSSSSVTPAQSSSGETAQSSTSVVQSSSTESLDFVQNNVSGFTAVQQGGMLLVTADRPLATVQIMDLQGRVVYKGTFSTNRATLAAPRPGIYLARVNGGIQKIAVK